MARRIAAALVAVLCTIAVPVGRSNAASGTTASIANYINMHGDQYVVVPNGHYSGGAVNAAHPATNGKYRGWLVLQARSRGGVVIDLSKGGLDLGPDTSRVLFIGFVFINGSVRAYGHDLAFWYTDHTFPASVWAAQAPSRQHPELGVYRAPRTVYVDKTTSQRVSFFGSNVHDTATAFMVSGSRDLLLQGITIERLTDAGLDTNDVVHPDAIAGVVGNTRGLTVRDSWIRGRVVIEDGAGEGGSTGGVNRDVLFQNTWDSGSPSAGFIFTASRKREPRGVFGKRIDVRSWGHHANEDRVDNIDGVAQDTPNAQPNRIDIVDQNVVTAPPPAGTRSPATKWRHAHPYDAWPGFFGFPAPPAKGATSATAIVVVLVAAAVLLVLLVWARLYRKRRRARRANIQ